MTLDDIARMRAHLATWDGESPYPGSTTERPRRPSASSKHATADDHNRRPRRAHPPHDAEPGDLMNPTSTSTTHLLLRQILQHEGDDVVLPPSSVLALTDTILSTAVGVGSFEPSAPAVGGPPPLPGATLKGVILGKRIWSVDEVPSANPTPLIDPLDHAHDPALGDVYHLHHVRVDDAINLPILTFARKGGPPPIVVRLSQEAAVMLGRILLAGQPVAAAHPPACSGTFSEAALDRS